MSETMHQGGPSPVGSALRRYRRRRGLSTRALGGRLAVAASYVSKIELGQRAPKPTFVAAAARALGLSDTDRQLLQALLALDRVEHRRVAGSVALRQAQRAVRQLEGACRSYRAFQLSLIPGLLQTRAYAHAILSRFATGKRLAESVAERLERQRILDDPRRRFRFLIADWALEPRWCTRRVMAEQLRHLRRLLRRPNIEIRILPRGLRFPPDLPPLVTGFVVLDEVAVVVDTLTGFATFRQPGEIESCQTAFDRTFALTQG